ncbi:hypothetical protein M404DRAFT_996288 [Pisolithus tinctorius Marx 270]|uniref:Uncharacterized protein n=1 Tax=Pisolithus tinctorius Marx 270 TaxID=870435 RepID=A0A0C3PM95_PISTI|nr:hypothetical protein M404DRAFT_996288 [Pisolithus tinctorius Marx 270]
MCNTPDILLRKVPTLEYGRRSGHQAITGVRMIFRKREATTRQQTDSGNGISNSRIPSAGAFDLP